MTNFARGQTIFGGPETDLTQKLMSQVWSEIYEDPVDLCPPYIPPPHPTHISAVSAFDCAYKS